MRYHPTPVRIAVIKKTTNNKCWQGYQEKGILCTTGENKIVAATMEKSMEIPQKIKNRTSRSSSNFTPGYLPKENKNTN